MLKRSSKVSILIPCYNGERLLHNSLDSILAQTYRNLQILFVNDGSTDNTETAAKVYETAFQNAGMEFLLYNKENGGAASAINVALRHYDGDYVMWLDSDDILLPQSIEKMLEFLENNPQYDYCMGEGVVVQENAYDHALWKLARIPVENETKDIMMTELLRGENSVYGPGTVMCKKQLVKTAIPAEGIYESRQGQNWQLLIPITYYGNRGYMKETLFKCVEHEDSHSRMKRDCANLIQREKEFITLCQQTIDSINKMPEEEKQKWKNLIEINHLQKMFRILISHWNFREAGCVGSQLKQKGCREVRHTSVFAAALMIFNGKVVRKIRKILRKALP